MTFKKVALFRSLFRGRDDVFPRRWENTAKGKSGYSPACDNECERGVCKKKGSGAGRRATCGECPNQAFVPVSDEEFAKHLRGDQVMGVYPLLPNETAWKGPVPMTTPLCTVVDCARAHALPDIVRQAVAQGLRRGLFSRTELKAALNIFDRFLAHVFAELNERIVVKGGVALELRLARARTTRDVDVRLTGDPEGLLDRLQQAGRRDLGDFLAFLVQPDPDTPVIEGDGMVYGGRENAGLGRLPARLPARGVSRRDSLSEADGTARRQPAARFSLREGEWRGGRDSNPRPPT
jgi:hypothetical protein